MAKSQQWTQWIYADAPQYGIDPEAAWAISTHEGLSGGVGDHGTSFGPFQLHVGGALPRGRGRKWAESRAGVDYALSQMAKSGARGLRGRRAIATISRRFERPANAAAEISDALAHYGRSGFAGRQMGLSTLARRTAQGAGPPPPGPDLAMIGSLLATVNPDVAPIFSALSAQTPSQAPSQAPRSLRKAPVAGQRGMRHSAAINELFYDPLGGIKNNQKIGAIGGHSDHVHMSLSNAQAQWNAIQQARRMGLRVGQDSDKNVTKVHVADSYHYRKYNKNSPLRMAADISGTPQQMSQFYQWVAANH